MKRAILIVCLLAGAASGQDAARGRYNDLTWEDIWPLLTEGLAIDIDATSIRFDPTELTGDRTWAAGAAATIRWIWDLTGGDPNILFGNDAISLMATTTNLGADGDIGNLVVHHAGTAKFWDSSDDTSVTLGPVGNGTTVLGITGSLNASGNVAGATYGSDSSISDAELLTLDNGATTELLVGGGAGSAPVWTTATGTGAPVRAGSPTMTGTPLVGTTAAGGNLSVIATEGAEMSPALEAVNWTCTDGWSAGTATLVKVAGAGTGTATPSGAFSVTAGVKYKVVITCSAVSGTLTYTLGGVTGTTITATTITDYIIASTTAKIIFSGGAAMTTTITSVSVMALTDATGDATIYGDLKANRIQNLKGTDVITIGPTGYVGVGTTNPGFLLDVSGLSAFRNYSTYYSGSTGSGYTGPSDGIFTGGTAATLGVRGLSSLWLGTSTTPTVAIDSTGRTGIGITVPATKLDQAQFSADALGSYHTFSKSRHATQGSHTIVVDNDVIGGIKFAPSDGVNFGTISAQITAEVDDAAPAADSIGGAVVISTAAGTASDDLAEHLRIDKSGDITHTSSNGGQMVTQCLVETVTIAAAASSGATSTITIPAGAVVENITWRVTQAAGGGPTAMNIYYTEEADLDTLCDNSVITLNTTGDIYTKGDLTYMAPTALHRTATRTITVQLHDGSNNATVVTGASFIIRIQCWIKKWVAPTS